jgi:thioesterase domain-containing protein/acyl carrier protein
LLFALGSLWQNGVSIDWDAFYAHEDRRRIPLPTYPFQRQRFWVDPAIAASAAPSLPAASSASATRSATELAESLASCALVATVPAGSPAASRKDRIAARVLDLLVPVSGRERSQISTFATFMEQGFDSLSLTQVAFALRKEFSAKVTFSQLMNQWPNVDLLAAHLDATLPAAILAETPAIPAFLPVTPQPATPPAGNASPKSSTLEGVVADQARTIARLVTLLERGGINNLTAGIPADTGTPVAAALPTAVSGPREVKSTVPQRGIYASSRLSEHLSASYNESMTVRFTGNISIEKMARAIERLVERHDALRASFDENGLTMKIAPALKIAMPVIDLSTVKSPTNAPAEQEERLRKLIADETALPFPLPAGPLFRCQMVLLGPDRAAVIFTAHHIICDGWSLDVLIHDLCAFYSEEISGTPESASVDQASSYAEYVQSVTDRDRSDEFKEAGNYWHAKFKDGFPVLVLPTDHPRTARREFSARRLDHPIPAPVVEKLRALGAQQGCSFFSVLLSSLAILLARVSRQRRFVIALPTAEQPGIGQPNLVGHCVNLLPFLVDLREGETVSFFLKRVQSELLTAQDHAIFTMVSLLEDLHPVVPALGVSPISVGLTNVKKFKQDELPHSGFTVDYDANPKGYESFEWYLNAIETEENLELRCHYDIDLFEEVSIREWFEALGSIFQDLAADPSREVLDLASLKCADTSPRTEILYTRSSNRETSDEFSSAVSAVTPKLPRQLSDSPAGSPTGETEMLRALLPLWQRVLDIREIGPDDDFFALGGHSVAAAQLFDLIQRELGCTAPLAILYDASTPRMLATVLSRGTKTEDWQSLVAINRSRPSPSRPPRSNDRPPLFLVHGAEGNVLLYRSLAAHLGADQPVYGLQSAGLDGHSPIDGRFEHVARRYIDEIRQVQPHGPYMLGGYCLGGTLALEMARQFIDSGETVGLVALIEIYNIRAMRWPLPLHQRLMNRFVLNPYFHLQNFIAAKGEGKRAFFTEKLRVETARIKASARFGWAGLRHRLLPNAAAPTPQAKIADIYEAALGQYDVRPYPGELTVFLAERHLAGYHAHLGGWGEVAQGGVRLFSLPISPRGSLVEPYVGQLAPILRDCLDRAIENSKTAAHEPSLELV